MADLALTLTDAGFPANFTGDAEAFKDAFIANLSATIDSASVILGQVGGTQPLTDVGPWLDDGVWKWFTGGTYKPMEFELINNGHIIFFNTLGTLTADREVQWQDKSGTVAYLEDIDNGRTGIDLTPQGHTAVSVLFSNSNNFFHTLDAGVTTNYNIGGSFPGQEIAILVVTGAATPINFNAGQPVTWAAGTQPTGSVSKTDLYIIKNVAGTLIGRAILDVR